MISTKTAYGVTISVMLTLIFASIAFSQTPTPATAAEQARMKPLIAAETKAREELNAKVATLPEAKTFQAAQDEYKKATEAFNKAAENLDIPEARAMRAARDALQKALDALNKSVEKLPENTAWKEAGAKSLDLAYQIQAEHKLSSREYKPDLNPQGELVFLKVVPGKP